MRYSRPACLWLSTASRLVAYPWAWCEVFGIENEQAAAGVIVDIGVLCRGLAHVERDHTQTRFSQPKNPVGVSSAELGGTL